MSDANRDGNHVPIALGQSSASETTTLPFLISSTTGRLLVDSASGSGDVVGPASATDNAVVLFDGTTGKLIKNSTIKSVTTVFSPTVSDGNSLGSGTLMWSDLFLASGGVINFNNGNMTVTHSAGNLTIAGGTLTIPTSGLVINATTVTSTGAQLNYLNGATGTTGTTSTNLVFSTSPTLVTPVLGAATGTSVVLSGSGAISSFANTVDSASVQVAIFQGQRATPTDADEGYISLKLSSDAPAQAEFARITWAASDVNVGTNLDGSLQFSTMVAGTLAKKVRLDANILYPFSNDLVALGAAATSWSDLFLASGALIGFANGDAVITHSTGILTVSTGDLRVTTAGTNSASVVTVGGAQTLTSKTLTAPVLNTGTVGTSLVPTSNDGAPLGDTTHQFSDLFLAEGGVINWDNGDLTLTQTNNELVMAGGNLDINGNILRLGDGGTTRLIVPTVDGTATGPTTSAFVSGYSSSAVGDLVYLDSSGKWQKTDADSTTTAYGLLGIALAVAATDAALLVALPGSIVYATAFPTLTIGATYYVGETAGAIQGTIPTGADNVIRVVGFGVHADKLFFLPSSDVQTTVA